MELRLNVSNLMLRKIAIVPVISDEVINHPLAIAADTEIVISARVVSIRQSYAPC